MKLILEYLKPFRRYIALALTVKISATLIELAIPYILSYILDEVVPLYSVERILWWGGAMLLCAALAFVGNVTANRMAAKVAKQSTEKIRHDLFSRVMTLSARQLDDFTIPSLESRLTSDTYQVHNFVGICMRMGIRAPILLLGGIILTIPLDPVLSLAMLVTMPLIGITVGIISKKGIPLYRKAHQTVDGMIRVVREDAQGIRVIKALSKTDFEKRRYDRVNKRLVDAESKAGITMSSSTPLATLLLNLGLVSVILVGALRVNGGLTEPGKIIAFIQYFTMGSTAMIVVTRIFVTISKYTASAQRIREVIEAEEDLALCAEEDYPPKEDDALVRFENVSFSYLGKKNTLSGISFSLKKGETLGIIGATGSGKTTLIRLLMRSYDVTEGSVRIGGRDVRTIPHDELNSLFGVVMQNDFLYAGSIAENIRFGRELSEKDIQRAATLAQASEFIEAYEDGYDHPLQSKGANISGGQKQRLLIARALAGAPTILILDDASSALDYKTDSRLRRCIREELKDVTTVVVAQRVSSVMHADRILVLDAGNLIACGTHEELMEACSIYREISDSQIGGAILD